MGKPAAVLGSFHTCPAITDNTPHGGGPALATSANVTVGGLPIACVGDRLVCAGPPDTISTGSATVIVNGKPVARLGDFTAHGGKITAGNPSVLIGG
jgi:uncharacterized Zn-binding protein involved in type VI secretion